MKLCLIGNNIEGSLSPQIHEAYNKIMKYTDSTYEIVQLMPDELHSFVSQLREGAYDGCNITAPFKLDIMQYLDGLSENTRVVGCANTVRRNGTSLIGYNTDNSGFGDQLDSDGINVFTKSVSVIGAGGAARAVVCELSSRGVKQINVYNRTLDHAKHVASDFPDIVKAYPIEAFTAKDSDIIINTSSGSNSIATIDGIAPDKIFIDINYKPEKTEFLNIAEMFGCRVYNGLKMLVFQAIRSEVKWRNLEDYENIQEIAEKIAKELDFPWEQE